jgi:hypothetical protein
MKRPRRALWWIAIVAALLFVSTFVPLALLEMNFFSNRPREPRPDAGLVAPLVIKNTRLYVTETEAAADRWLWRFDIGMLVVLAFAGALAGGLDLSRRPD